MAADDAVHYQSLVGVQTVVQGLTLTGITPGGNPLPSNQVYLKKLLTDRGVTFPACVISLPPVPEATEAGTNAQDDWGYPCLVTLLFVSNQDLTLQEPELKWRQQIKQVFHNKRPAALVSAVAVPIKICRWEPGPVVNLGLFQNENLTASPAIIRVFTRETR